jgi:hypothetical protein
MSPLLAAEWWDWRLPADYRAAACAWRCWNNSSAAVGGGCAAGAACLGDQCRQRKTADAPWRLVDIVAHRASCYHGMEVWDKDSFGRIALMTRAWVTAIWAYY